jgi:hypothetical protein
MPTVFESRYSDRDYTRFLVCVLTVSWKLATYELPALDCLGEVLAMNAILIEAEFLFDPEFDEPIDFDALKNHLFENRDHESLFDPPWIEIVPSDHESRRRREALDLKNWFTSYGGENGGAIHRYIEFATFDSDEDDLTPGDEFENE